MGTGEAIGKRLVSRMRWCGANWFGIVLFVLVTCVMTRVLIVDLGVMEFERLVSSEQTPIVDLQSTQRMFEQLSPAVGQSFLRISYVGTKPGTSTFRMQDDGIIKNDQEISTNSGQSDTSEMNINLISKMILISKLCDLMHATSHGDGDGRVTL